MADGRFPQLFTIPPHRAFADALVSGLLAQAGDDRMKLARTIVVLPSNRAQRTLTEAFVRRAEGGLLLPRMVAIGDPELGERVGPIFDPADGSVAYVPPAIEPLDRQLALARIVQQVRARRGDPVDAAEALRLAADLATALDQLLVEEVPPARLRDIVAPELSEHWLSSLEALEAILDLWPAELKRRGRIDLADRRNRLIDSVSAHWRVSPPAVPVVAAGISTASPAVARLLATIARMPQGTVVFSGLDCEMPDAEWDALGPHEVEEGRSPARNIETHPQFHLKLLLERMGFARAEVQRWRWGGRRAAPASRTRAVANAMAPAAFTARWQALPPAERRLPGVRLAIFATPGEEAQAIAVALREVVETPGRTAALVTPDRTLAARVIAHLKRWDIEADDSAGRALSLTPSGSLLLQIAEIIAEDFSPIPLLALLKHPLVAGGDQRIGWLDAVRRLDLALRGPRPPSGIAGITAFLSSGEGRDARLRRAALGWWTDVAAALEPLEQVRRSPDFAGCLRAVREVASALAGDSVWAGPAGRQAADLVSQLELGAADGPALDRVESLPVLLRDLFDGVAVRPPQGGHPRIFIRGLLEARLVHEDLVILGGLNEGVWPAAPAPDPWLAPTIRRTLGLPGLERRIGLAAHDLVTALGAPQVLITRARRDARSPTIASRFLLRLEAMTGGVTRAIQLCRWSSTVDRSGVAVPPASRPMPCPPLAARPTRLAVTRLDRLKADPFAFYADAMLKLSRLDPVDSDPTPAWRGNMVHTVFEAWMKEDDCNPARLRPRADAMLAEMAAHPVLRALWTPRLREAIGWIATTMEQNLASGRRPLVAEVFGETAIAGITLYGKVDRIDRLADGTLAIVDYKTGKPPSTSQVQAGFAMQLGLLGLIAERGGFDHVAGTPACYEYWSTARDKGQFGHIKSPVGTKNGIDAADFMPLAARNLEEAVGKWLTGTEPFMAKLHPEFAPYGDYDQLMRLDEWYGRADG